MKPILFNTDMVRAILDGRKTVTRRAVKPQPEGAYDIFDCDVENHTFDLSCGNGGAGGIFLDWTETIKAPLLPGEILYVRETWRIWRAHRYDADAHIEFKAGGKGSILQFQHGGTDSVNRDDYDSFVSKWGVGGKWRPSIHMPREAARIFLRVTDVRVERLQDISYDDCLSEGITNEEIDERDAFRPVTSAKWLFEHLWSSTIKKSDRALYGWDASPWVWVIEFERISREEAMKQ